MTQKQKTHRLAVAAMLTAVAAVLQFVEFAIPLMPSFIKLDISDLPALLGTFSLGPVYGVAIQLAKNLLHLPFGSSAGVGAVSYTHLDVYNRQGLGCKIIYGNYGIGVYILDNSHIRGKNQGLNTPSKHSDTAALTDTPGNLQCVLS